MCSPQTTETGTRKLFSKQKPHYNLYSSYSFIVTEFLYVKSQCYNNDDDDDDQLGFKRKLVLRYLKQIMTFFLPGPVVFIGTKLGIQLSK